MNNMHLGEKIVTVRPQIRPAMPFMKIDKRLLDLIKKNIHLGRMLSAMVYIFKQNLLQNRTILGCLPIFWPNVSHCCRWYNATGSWFRQRLRRARGGGRPAWARSGKDIDEGRGPPSEKETGIRESAEQVKLEKRLPDVGNMGRPSSNPKK